MSNSGQWASAIVGGVIGFIYGGPVGAAYGIQIGLMAGGLLFPTQLDPVFGPRIEDLATTSAQVGVPVVQTWGTIAVPGTVMWLGPVKEVATTEVVGGKGGPEQEVTTYSYYQPIAVGLSEGPIGGVSRIWENGKLAYDMRAPQPGETLEQYNERRDASEEYADGFTLYRGTADQLPDPTIESFEGMGNVPAFRDLAYIVFHNWQLKDEHARRHPQRRFEVFHEFVAEPRLIIMENSNHGVPGSFARYSRIAPAFDADLMYHFHDQYLTGGSDPADVSLGASAYNMLNGALLTRRTWPDILGPNAFTRWMKRGQAIPLSSDGRAFFLSWSTSTDITQPDQGTHYVARIDGESLTAEVVRENVEGSMHVPQIPADVVTGPIPHRWDHAAVLPTPAGDVLLVVMTELDRVVDSNYVPGGVGEFALVDAQTMQILTRPLDAVPGYQEGDGIIGAQLDARWWGAYLGNAGLDDNFRPSAAIAGRRAGSWTEAWLVWEGPGVGLGQRRWLIGRVRVHDTNASNPKWNWDFDIVAEVNFADVFPDVTDPISTFDTFYWGEPWILFTNGPQFPRSRQVWYDPSDDTLVFLALNTGDPVYLRLLKFDPNAGTVGEIKWVNTIYGGTSVGVGLWQMPHGHRYTRIVNNTLVGVVGAEVGGVLNDEPQLSSIDTTDGTRTLLQPVPNGADFYSAFDPLTRRLATVGYYPGDRDDWLPATQVAAVIDFRPVAVSTRGTSVAQIVEAIGLRVGFDPEHMDVSELQDVVVQGYARTRVMTAKDAIAPLRMIGFFDCVETGPLLRWPRRGGPAVATLALEDLGAHVAGEDAPPAITTRKAQDIELPRRIRVHYVSPARDYEPGEQVSPVRLTAEAVNESDVDLVAALDDTQAARIAEVIWADAWRARWIHQTSVDRRWAGLEPADPVLVPVDDRLERMRVVSLEDSDVVLRRIELVRDDDGAYESTALATPPQVTVPPPLQRLASTDFAFLDTPALRESDDDAGFYVAAWKGTGGSRWDGAIVYRSTDGGANWSQVAVVPPPRAIHGTVTEAPLAGNVLHTTWDSGAIVVELDDVSMSLSSATRPAVLAGANVAAIGQPGRWEIMQFETVENIAERTWRLYPVLRGRRGTEHHIASVEAGDHFVMLSAGGVARVALETSRLGAPVLYRVVSIGATLASAEPQEFVGSGRALHPFAPVHIEGTRDTSGDLLITWMRRDRLHQTLRSGVPLPNSETAEAYEVDIGTGDVSIRTLTSSTPSVVYTAEQQTEDFGAPVGPEDSVGGGQADVSFAVTGLAAGSQVIYRSPLIQPPSGFGSIVGGDLGGGFSVQMFGWAPGQGLVVAIMGEEVPDAAFFASLDMQGDNGPLSLDTADAITMTDGPIRMWIWTSEGGSQPITAGQEYTVELVGAQLGGGAPGVPVRIYQLSSIVGRGTPGDAHL